MDAPIATLPRAGENQGMLPLVLALRFTLELVLLAVFGWWGFALGRGGPPGWVIGILSAAGIAVFWGVLLSPKARIALPSAARNVVEVAVFIVAAGTLATRGHALWGALLVAADVLVLVVLWRLYATTEPSSTRSPRSSAAWQVPPAIPGPRHPSGGDHGDGPDKVRLVANVDEFPNVVALRIEGARFAATTRDAAGALLRVEAWDAANHGWCSQ